MEHEFEYGFDLDEQQRIDNEQYENNWKVIRVINDENTPPPNVHKVPKGKNVKDLIKNKKPKNWIKETKRKRRSDVVLSRTKRTYKSWEKKKTRNWT